MRETIDRDDYTLRLLIESMQQQGKSEREIETAVRAASRRLERQRRAPHRRANRLRLLGRRLRRPAR
jgi:hypothetical protein